MSECVDIYLRYCLLCILDVAISSAMITSEDADKINE